MSHPLRCFRIPLLLVALALAASLGARTASAQTFDRPEAAVDDVQQSAPAAEAAPPAEHGAAAEAGEHEEGWMGTVAKAFNFALLAGILVYFLKAPIVQYLSTRGETIRRDLVEAKAVRSTAETQLGAVRSRLAALPAELDSLRARGREELAQERERLTKATAREREHLLDRTRREIDLQSRMARRALTVHAAELTTALARTRIEQSMTAQDQMRLVDRYTADVQR